MKYCSGKYHGDVKKQIEDNEDYCLLCCGRIANEKEEKKKKGFNILLNIGKVVVAATPLALGVANLVKDKATNLVKDKDES